MTVPSAEPHRLTPAPSARPWGGGRFGSIDGVPVGELWVSGDEARLPDGRTLSEAGLAAGVPLVKVLDVAALLSVQVHPDDAEALELAGPDGVGKHEAWVVLEAGAGSSLLLGLAPGASAEDLFSGDPARVTAALGHLPVRPGDVIDVAPGTVHAPDAGIVLYEIQQRSDLTYRIWDWGRPRALHLREARHCLRPDAAPSVGRLPDVAAAPGLTLLSQPSAPFRLAHLRVDGPTRLELDGPGVLSVIEGTIGLGRLDAEMGSHWLLDAGSCAIDGAGVALVAAWQGAFEVGPHP